MLQCQCNLTSLMPLLDVMRNILCLLRKDRLELLNSRFAITQCDYLLKMSSPMLVCTQAGMSDMTLCAIEWQLSEAAFEVWLPKIERASRGKCPYGFSATPDLMIASYTQAVIGLPGRRRR